MPTTRGTRGKGITPTAGKAPTAAQKKQDQDKALAERITELYKRSNIKDHPLAPPDSHMALLRDKMQFSEEQGAYKLNFSWDTDMATAALIAAGFESTTEAKAAANAGFPRNKFKTVSRKLEKLFDVWPPVTDEEREREDETEDLFPDWSSPSKKRPPTKPAEAPISVKGSDDEHDEPTGLNGTKRQKTSTDPDIFAAHRPHTKTTYRGKFDFDDQLVNHILGATGAGTIAETTAKAEIKKAINRVAPKLRTKKSRTRKQL